MEGPNDGSGDDEENIGMIPRAVTQVFETAAELTDKGWQVIACLAIHWFVDWC